VGLNVPSTIRPEKQVEKVKPNFYPAQNALAKTHLISNALTDNIMSDQLTIISGSGRVFEMVNYWQVLLANPPLQKSQFEASPSCQNPNNPLIMTSVPKYGICRILKKNRSHRSKNQNQDNRTLELIEQQYQCGRFVFLFEAVCAVLAQAVFRILTA
jgi:hypothetical protein